MRENVRNAFDRRPYHMLHSGLHRQVGGLYSLAYILSVDE